MARAKLEMVGANEVTVGQTIHFTAAGTGFEVIAVEENLLTVRRTAGDTKLQAVPFTRMTQVVVER